MKTEYLITFIVTFILPIAYQRIHFEWRQKDFLTTPLRTKTHLQIHHGHWGLLWIFVSFIMFMNEYKNFYSVALGGFGWGLLIDEVIPSLKMPSKDRILELTVYRETRNASIMLATVVLIIISIVSIMNF